MISRLLIANRGEIACRIARTAHRLGIDTVGVFSEADRGALHTRVVDRAVCLGGTSPGESYLRGDAVIAAALATGADAIHPGYGFLSENAAFARQVEAEGLIWVGPTPEQIELLGDKVAAKQAAVRAGVPTTEAVVVDPAVFSDPLTGAEVVAGLPVPAMVKAAAGGGGRGMRIVRERGEFADVVTSASREAEAAFGDGTVFVEPLIECGRHVEVQVLADSHGNVVHLGERDCSIQRRHQKVIEEAPSPGIDEAIREALCNGAVSLAAEVGYRGAGTVEYLVGTDGTISFLEVNTRLQVEHPVTEAVWGVDLVELQLLVASGAELPFSQHELVPCGHAIEARLVAEDPAAGWMPSTGVIEAFSFDVDHDVQGACPRSSGIRVDSGVAAGSVVGSHYDSLLAKVIAYGSNRASVAASLARSLRRADLAGLRTNADALAAICIEDSFLAGSATTAYLDEHPEVTAARGPEGDDRLMQCLVALFAIEHANRSADTVTGFAPSGWRNVVTQGQRVTLMDLGAESGAEAGLQSGGGSGQDETGRPVALEYRFTARSSTGDRNITAEHDVTASRGCKVMVGTFPQPDVEGMLAEDTRRVGEVIVRRVEVVQRTGIGPFGCTDRHAHGPVRRGGGTRSTWQIELDGVSQTLEVTLTPGLDDPMVRVRGTTGRTVWKQSPRFAEHDEAEAATGPVSPLPGSVVSVHVTPGDTVADGGLLVVIEAMKMEHRITARSEVTVAEVRVAVGDKVDAGEVLVTFADN